MKSELHSAVTAVEDGPQCLRLGSKVDKHVSSRPGGNLSCAVPQLHACLTLFLAASSRVPLTTL